MHKATVPKQNNFIKLMMVYWFSHRNIWFYCVTQRITGENTPHATHSARSCKNYLNEATIVWTFKTTHSLWLIMHWVNRFFVLLWIFGWLGLIKFYTLIHHLSKCWVRNLRTLVKVPGVKAINTFQRLVPSRSQ